MVGHLPVLDPHDVDLVHLDLLPGGGDTHQLALVGAPRDRSNDHLVVLGHHVDDLLGEIGKGGPQHLEDVLDAFQPRWLSGHGSVVDAVLRDVVPEGVVVALLRDFPEPSNQLLVLLRAHPSPFRRSSVREATYRRGGRPCQAWHERTSRGPSPARQRRT